MSTNLKIPVVMSVSGRFFGFVAAAYIAHTLGTENFAFLLIWYMDLLHD